ncbi:hypothetical protein ACHAWF_009490, partial [Thalassiosira exigua]
MGKTVTKRKYASSGRSTESHGIRSVCEERRCKVSFIGSKNQLLLLQCLCGTISREKCVHLNPKVGK